MGHVVTFHVIIVGGDNLKGTVEGFQYITDKFKGDSQILIWLNPFFGKIERDGKSFDQFSVFAENSKFVDAIINYPDFPKDMFGKSFAKVYFRVLFLPSDALLADINVIPSGKKTGLLSLKYVMLKTLPRDMIG